MTLRVKLSPKFQRALDNGDELQKKVVCGEVQQFARVFQHSPMRVSNRFDTLRGVDPHTVLVLRPAKHLSVFGHWENQTLTLVDMGAPHHVYRPFSKRILEYQLSAAAHAGEEFFPAEFIGMQA